MTENHGVPGSNPGPATPRTSCKTRENLETPATLPGSLGNSIERQYRYLHTLEDKISAELQDDELYRREGRAYKSEDSPFRGWVRRFYVVVLPVIAIIATGVLIYQEWTRLEYPLLSKTFDSISASGVAVSFALYRIVPLVSGAVKKLKKRDQPPSS